MAKSNSPVLTHAAENIGAALGVLSGKINAWKKQRAEIHEDLNKVIAHAQDMLKEVGHQPHDGLMGSLGEIAHVIPTSGRPKGYKMSEATKTKLRAAWKKRKAIPTKVGGPETPGGRKRGKNPAGYEAGNG